MTPYENLEEVETLARLDILSRDKLFLHIVVKNNYSNTGFKQKSIDKKKEPKVLKKLSHPQGIHHL